MGRQPSRQCCTQLIERSGDLLHQSLVTGTHGPGLDDPLHNHSHRAGNQGNQNHNAPEGGVAQVVTFAVPHDMLGEDIAAAVVLREGAACDERELRAFVGSRVADFKIPRRIVFLEEIPKGATGKLQRIGLHEKLAQKLGMAG